MSDTDDTDVLLLIPPDFFFVHSDSDTTTDDRWSKPHDLHPGIVKSLLDELDDIKSRVASIENSEVSSIYRRTNEDFGSSDSNMSGRNYLDEYNSKFMSSSSRSTPQKAKMKLNLSSLPNTPNELERRKLRRNLTEFASKAPGKHAERFQNDRDADESSITTTPEKKNNNEVLGEIDQFLSHVKTIKRYVTQKKLENSFPPDDKQPQSLPISFENSPLKLSDLNSEKKPGKSNHLDMKDVDKFLSEMEKQQKKMQSHKPFDMKRIVEGNEVETHTWKPGENKNSAPDYGYGMRDIMFSNNDHQKVSKTLQNYIPHKSDTNLESDSTNGTPPTVFERSSGEDLLPHVDASHSSNIVYDFVPLYSEAIPQKLPPPEEPIVRRSNTSLQASRYKRNYAVDQAPSTNLYEMSDPWGYSRGDFLAKDVKMMSKLEEERFRRQHCEKIIQDLQLKYLEMQQRLAVAVQVDCAKDAAILRFHEAWEKVADRWQALETERNQLAQKLSTVKGKSDTDIAEAKKKVVHYEQEISKALDLAHKNSEKCHDLESERGKLLKELEKIKAELEKITRKFNETDNERKELKQKCIDIERFNLEDKKILLELQKENENLKNSSSNELIGYQTEIKQLCEEKSLLEKQIKDVRGSCEDLAVKNKHLELAIQNCKKNEKSLQHEIKNLVDQTDKAKVELRNFYQQQVELLVKDKLKEFQAQLEQTERVLNEELQNREQTIAKTAAKQLQKLADKHNLEVRLVEEKHREEINLYEIQVSQLKHLIATQQSKLDHIQMKRNNIAQELKTVMEAQWNEALKIINNGRSPDTASTGIQPRFTDRSGFKQFFNTKELPEHETEPERPPLRPENDLQKYIKMLLDKEPGSVGDDDDRSHPAKPAAADNNHNLSTYSKVSDATDDAGDRKLGQTREQHRMSKPPWK